MPQMELPRDLGHKPVFALPYFDRDGGNAGATDCQFLSVGWAQYNRRQLSAKVLRHPGRRWSRQSEELPLHRLIDAASLVALCLGAHDRDALPVEAGFFENQGAPLAVERAEVSPADRDDFSRVLLGDGVTRRRLSKLADLLIGLRECRMV